MTNTKITKYIISMLAQNKPGVLSKVTGLLRRKCFQIDSLTAGTTADPNISQMTLVITGEVSTAHQAASQLEKIVEMLSVNVIERKNAIVREVVIARFKPHNDAQEKRLLKEVKKIFHKEIYRNKNEVCVELVDTTYGLEDFLVQIKNAKIQVLEWIRSGVIAIENKA